MKTEALPQTDSVQELAQFWDTHDVTDFEDELEEVTEPVFARRKGAARPLAISVPLAGREARAVERMAQASGISSEQLVRRWVLQKLARRARSIRSRGWIRP